MSEEAILRRAAFDACAADFGGRYIATPEEKAQAQAAYNEKLRVELLGNFVSSARRGGQPILLEIGQVQDASLNAFAAHHQGVDIIALNSGNISRLLCVTYYMLDASDAFDDFIGNEPRLGFGLDADELRYGILPEQMPHIEAAKNRLELALDLGSLTERFLIFHELSHILNGHIDWLGERFGARMLAERRTEVSADLSMLDYQTLEYDADATAIGIIVGGRVRRGMHRSGRGGECVPIVFDKAIAFEIRCLAFSLYTLFKLFESAPCKSVEEVLKDDHPPARVRAQFASVSLIQYLEHDFSIPPGVYRDTIVRTFLEAEAAWNTLTGEKVDHIFTDEDLDLGAELMEIYNDRWRDIHPDLDRLKLSGKIAKP